MKNTKLYFFAIALFFFGSCNTEEEQIPAYVHVKPFILGSVTAPANASKFIDGWVFNASTGDFLGAYEVPSTFPILENGKTNLIIEPGIKVNGISATPDAYTMVERFEIEVDLAANKTDTIQPITNYRSDVVFKYTEDFEGVSTLNVGVDTFGIFPEPGTMGALPGNGKSASFTLTPDNPTMQVAASVRMDIPTDRGQTFLEINYKCEGFLQLGLMGYSAGQADGKGEGTYIVALNPRDEWNKVYIELSNDILSVNQDIIEFQVLIGANHDETLTSTSFSVDNIRVLYTPRNKT